MSRTLVFLIAVGATLGLAACGSGDKKYVDPECGNDDREVPEVCDGADLAGESCESLGFDGGTLMCASTCLAFDTTHCTGDPCGNGSLDAGEVCDGDELRDATCESLGFDGGTLGCLEGCGGYDVSDCTGEGCGNGVMEGEEECDGEDLGDATCESLGEPAGNLGCNPDCTFDTTFCGCEPDCGDRECGDDGCGGSCGECTAPETCNAFGECTCIPSCEGRECGDNGCGGSCGTCDAPETCNDDGECECIPECTDRECGDDGCGGSCGECTFPEICDEDVGLCDCTPDCTGLECGDDGCGGSCGECGEGLSCVDGACVCVPDCTGLECGPDGCGGSCGECEDGLTCVDGDCLCVPDCTGRECGDDGCGGSCGTCSVGEACLEGLCQCVPDCTGLECGPDGCGGSCGSCPVGYSCSSGTCVCSPDCTGRECGPDGCGGSCGTCSGGEVCDVSSGLCSCVPDCAGRECGDDGCGGACGVCTYPYVCITGSCHPPEGDTCANPFVLDTSTLPVVETGSTLDASDDLGFAAGECSGVGGERGSASSDEVWALTAPETGIYTITLAPGTGYDPVLYVLTDCADSASCMRAADTLGDETLRLTLTAGTTYYIVVDGYDNASNEAGTYTLTVSDPCIPDCTGRVCGPDGCGGSCGACPDGEECNTMGTCDPLEGNTCEAPFYIDARYLPYTTSGDTTDAFNSYSFADDTCAGEEYGRGAMSPDEAYEFVPMVDGLYTITVTPASDFDPTVYVVTDCDSITTATCIGANQEYGDGLVETLQVHLSASVTYYIIVDGWTNYSEDMGTYTLEVDGPCEPDCAGKECGSDGCLGSCGTCSGAMICDPSGICVMPDPGDTCGYPFLVPTGTLPWMTTGDTTVALNQYWFGDDVCPGSSFGYGAGSNDQAYSFTPTMSATYTITLDPVDFDSLLYVVTDCDTITTTTCLGADDNVGSPETLTLSLTSGVTYFIIVDGYTNSSNEAGNYSLTVSSP